MTYNEVYVNVWPENSGGEFEEVIDVHFFGPNKERDSKKFFEQVTEIFMTLTNLDVLTADEIHIVWQERKGKPNSGKEENDEEFELREEWSWKKP